MPNDLKYAIEALRREGYAICVFTPEELSAHDVNAEDLEEQLAREGNEYLDLLSPAA